MRQRRSKVACQRAIVHDRQPGQPADSAACGLTAHARDAGFGSRRQNRQAGLPLHRLRGPGTRSRWRRRAELQRSSWRLVTSREDPGSADSGGLDAGSCCGTLRAVNAELRRSQYRRRWLLTRDHVAHAPAVRPEPRLAVHDFDLTTFQARLVARAYCADAEVAACVHTRTSSDMDDITTYPKAATDAACGMSRGGTDSAVHPEVALPVRGLADARHALDEGAPAKRLRAVLERGSTVGLVHAGHSGRAAVAAAAAGSGHVREWSLSRPDAANRASSAGLSTATMAVVCGARPWRQRYSCGDAKECACGSKV